MTFAEALALFTAQLRADPAAPRPPLVTDTVEHLHEWKMLQRAYDQAQLDLGILTPSEMQRINSAVQVDPATAHRVVRYPQYV
ncbi:MAG: hypothetical protein H7343_18890 [Undibacterium sp.]|nr:hypothetical protein [Opitutaceae bacterium]